MPYRTTALINQYYYHIYNRSISNHDLFQKPNHYHRFERTASYYLLAIPPTSFSFYIRLGNQTQQEIQTKLINMPRICTLISFVLMPNHYHFIVRQEQDGGISNFIRKLSNSYTRYYNTANKRKGPLFQGPFKAKLIATDEQLIHLSRYIHLNPVVAGLTSKHQVFDYPYSSLSQFLNNIPSSLLTINPSPVLSHFNSATDYHSFVSEQIDYQSELHRLKKLLIDTNS
jgi:putative transposase